MQIGAQGLGILGSLLQCFVTNATELLFPLTLSSPTSSTRMDSASW